MFTSSWRKGVRDVREERGGKRRRGGEEYQHLRIRRDGPNRKEEKDRLASIGVETVMRKKKDPREKGGKKKKWGTECKMRVQAGRVCEKK